jgi:hypothetical protein
VGSAALLLLLRAMLRLAMTLLLLTLDSITSVGAGDVCSKENIAGCWTLHASDMQPDAPMLVLLLLSLLLMLFMALGASSVQLCTVFSALLLDHMSG